MSHLIDSLAYTNRLRGLPPMHKFGFAIALLLGSLIAPVLVQLLIGLWIAVWIVGYAGIPARLYLRLLSVPLGFWLTSLPAFVINGIGLNHQQSTQWDVWRGWGIPLGSLYLYISQTGLHQLSLLFVRTLATTSCLYFILLTIPFTEILQILRQLRCPLLVTELLMLMYRFIFSLSAIADELWVAQNARSGYRTRQRGMHSLGILIGQLLQRTLESYRQVSLSLAARGFTGELRVSHSRSYQSSRRYTLEALLGCSVLVALSVGNFIR
jgi:cobalt/nickel transport system permease protein